MIDSQGAVPKNWIDRLFARLTAKFPDFDGDKEEWAGTLANIPLDVIAQGLKAAQDKQPTANEFLELCRPRIAADTGSPQRRWARVLKARHERGEPMDVIQIEMYRKALHL